MSRRAYHVGLVPVTPRVVHPRGRAAPSTAARTVTVDRPPTSFTAHEPETADRILAAAVSRGAYLDAQAHLYGCGFSPHAAPFPSAVGEAFPASDLWALVLYDDRTYGPGTPPQVLYGDGRHVATAFRLPLVWAGAACAPPEDRVGYGLRPGFVPHGHAARELPGLFVILSVGADLRF